MGFVSDVLANAKKRREKRKVVKEAEKDAYKKQKEIKESTELEDAIRKAQEKGIEKATLTPVQRIKKKAKERKENVAAKREQQATSEKPTKPKLEGFVITSTSEKKDVGSLLGISDKPKKDFSELIKGK